MYSIKNREDWENLNELVSLNKRVDELRLQDKLGKQNFHENMKKLYVPITETTNDTALDISKTMTETSIKNNKARENFIHRLSEILLYRCLLATILMSPLSKITTPQNTCQFKLIEDPNSNRVNDLLIHKAIRAVTPYNKLLTLRDADKMFELQGDLLKMITNKNYNLDHANLSDKKVMYELCERLKILLQEKQAGNTSDMINQKIVAIIDKLVEYRCISTKQIKILLFKCSK